MSNILRKLCDNCGKEVAEKDSYNSVVLAKMSLICKWVTTDKQMALAVAPDYCLSCFEQMLDDTIFELRTVRAARQYIQHNMFRPACVESKADR